MTDLSTARQGPAVTVRPWLQPLAARTRFTLRGGAEVMERAGRAFGVDLPRVACRASTSGARAALWLGPDEILLLAPEAETESVRAGLESALTGVPHSLVDSSHRQTALELSGAHAADVLNGASPLDLSLEAFPVGMCTRTLLEKADVVLWRTREDAFHIEVWRSFTGYVSALLAQIGSEYGP